MVCWTPFIGLLSQLQLGYKNHLFLQTVLCVLCVNSSLNITTTFFWHFPIFLIPFFTAGCDLLSPQAQLEAAEQTSMRGNEMGMTTFFLLVRGFCVTHKKPAVQMPASNRPQRRHFIPQPSLYEGEQSISAWFGSTCTETWQFRFQLDFCAGLWRWAAHGNELAFPSFNHPVSLWE